MLKYTLDHRKISFKRAIITFLTWGALFSFVSCDNKVYEKPQLKDIREVVFASGHIETEDHYSIISAVDGYIEKSSIKEGMVVEHGAVLAEISQDTPKAQLKDAIAGHKEAKSDIDPNSPKLQEVDLKIGVAKKELAQNEKLLESYEKLVLKNAVSKIDLENHELKTERSRKDLKVLEDSKRDLLSSLELNLENAENLLKIRRYDFDNYLLTATGKSQVLKSYHKEGEYIRRGETFAEMGKGTPLVKLFIEEGDINDIDIGQTVELSVNTYDDILFTGEIVHIQPSFDDEQQSFIVEAKFLDVPERIFSGTQVQANILTSQKEDVLVIPSKSLVSKNEVITKDKGLVQLQLGIQNHEWVEVLAGISEDDLVLVESKE